MCLGTVDGEILDKGLKSAKPEEKPAGRRDAKPRRDGDRPPKRNRNQDDNRNRREDFGKAEAKPQVNPRVRKAPKEAPVPKAAVEETAPAKTEGGEE